MGLKEVMLNRIEKDSIKVDVNGQKVYLKKSGLIKEWRVIYPPVNPETGKWDLVNLIFGGKANAVKYFFIGVILLLLAFGVMEVINSYNATMANPAVQACLNNSRIALGG